MSMKSFAVGTVAIFLKLYSDIFLFAVCVYKNSSSSSSDDDQLNNRDNNTCVLRACLIVQTLRRRQRVFSVGFDIFFQLSV